jgi:hypothetical protein
MREGSSFNYADTIATKTPSDNYYPKLICRGGKPWDTWKIDVNMEFCKCLGGIMSISASKSTSTSYPVAPLPTGPN